MRLRLLDTDLAVCRLTAGEPLPAWFALDAPVSCAMRRGDELSLVCASSRVPDGVVAERGWRAFEVAGPLDLAMTGVLAALAGTLARAEVPVFALATYDTDVLLVRTEHADRAAAAFERDGHDVER